MDDIDYPIPLIDLIHLHTDCSSLLIHIETCHTSRKLLSI